MKAIDIAKRINNGPMAIEGDDGDAIGVYGSLDELLRWAVPMAANWRREGFLFLFFYFFIFFLSRLGLALYSDVYPHVFKLMITVEQTQSPDQWATGKGRI